MPGNHRKYTKISFKNKAALEAEAQCSCYHCNQVMPVDQVVIWVDEGETGVCPKCGVDALLPGCYSVSKLLEIGDLFAH